MAARIEALLFDVFGTLVDWRTGIAERMKGEFKRYGIDCDPSEFADRWRAEYQPSMRAIRNGSRRYVALDRLHLENLEKVLGDYRIREKLPPSAIAPIAAAWEELPPWPDTVAGLRRLKKSFLIGACSNASIALMTRLSKFADLSFDAILGADIAKNFKPDPSVYVKSAAALDVDPACILMVAAHVEDLKAAAECGFGTAFIARAAEFGGNEKTDELPGGPWDHNVKSLPELADRLAIRQDTVQSRC